MARTLIAFFSRADENYFGGAMRYVKVGNTEIVCNIMKELIPADSFKIEMKNPYSPVYMTCIEEAKKDLRSKARPELVAVPESIDQYDTIVLAYPNYWGTMPMAVFTFLEQFDFSGTWLSLPSSSSLIFPARPSFPSAPMRAAAWAAASATSNAPAPAQPLKKVFPSLGARQPIQRAVCSAG